MSGDGSEPKAFARRAPRAGVGPRTPSASCILAVACALLVALTFVSCPATASADGATPTVPTSVGGTVANHTKGAPAPGKVTVTLRTYRNQQLQTTSQAETDAAGRYQFSGLSTDPAYQYLPVVQYEGVSYTGDAVRLADAQSDAAHDDVAIFETTAQDPGLRYDNATLVLGSVEQASQHLSFLELLTLENPSDRTYVPATPSQGMATGLLRFSLPAGVDDIGVQNGLDTSRLLEVDGGLASASPIAPGVHSVSFSFAVPYRGAGFTFAWNLIYPAASVHVLVPLNGPALRAGNLSAAPDLPVQGHDFHVLSGGAVGANTTINVAISRLPGRTPLQAVQAALPAQKAVAVGALVVAVLAALVPVIYLLRRRRSGKVAPEQTADGLLDALAALDDAHERGELDDAAYTERRAALKTQLARRMPNVPVEG